MDTTQFQPTADPNAPIDPNDPSPELLNQAGALDPQATAPAIDPAEVEDLRRRYEERDREANELRARQQRYDAQLAQQAAAAWRQQEQQVRQAAEQMDDPAQAAAYVQQQYAQREQFLLAQNQQFQQQVYQERVAAFADNVIREHGLSEADRTRLLYVGQNDPNAMHTEAQRIKGERDSSRSEIDQLKQQIEQLTRGQQAQAMRQSGAWQGGGSNPLPPNSTIVPGSRDHLKHLLGVD